MRSPNILFILADDLGWCDLGVGGSDFYESPNIDRIAKDGMQFTQGYAACQVCSPSRASILTGKYSPRHGITDYIGGPSGEAWRAQHRFSKMLPPTYERRLRPCEITFAEVLRQSGYRTFFAGKWHVGGEDAGPEQFGFEIAKHGFDKGGLRYFSPWPNANVEPASEGECLAMRLARETAQFITQHREEPFLAYLSFHHVHSPIQTTRERWEKFRNKAIAKGKPDRRFSFDRNLPVRQVQDCPIYAGMVEAMDDAVGLVLDTLDKHGLSENTVVCFTSDNGGVSSGDAYSSSMLPLRGGKGRQWEGGIREPLYFRIPKVIKAASTCRIPVSGIDLYPTFLEFAGLPVPSEQVIDGKSIVSLLEGHQDKGMAERDLFWHYPHYANQGGDPSSIIRSGPWKLIHYYEDGHDELYNLELDPGEQSDRLADNSAKASQLRQRLDNWLVEVEAKFPVPDPEYDPEKERARLYALEHEFMPKLEVEHSRYLDPDWQPDKDWWGSQITTD